ncbi:MAG: hypothetical protein HS127_11765 [Planctomycetia bacterium]|uniref:hypothetical protein n=1 Tax=Candidatus Kuenenia sp. TaxID=2499824 RepID=UPI001E0A3A3E|nr:hypothetical protein [Planctomycetia bacterium]
MDEELRDTIEQGNRTIKEMRHLVYFSSLMNDEVHEESLFNTDFHTHINHHNTPLKVVCV